jgi:hypothetical protein
MRFVPIFAFVVGSANADGTVEIGEDKRSVKLKFGGDCEMNFHEIFSVDQGASLSSIGQNTEFMGFIADAGVNECPESIEDDDDLEIDATYTDGVFTCPGGDTLKFDKVVKDPESKKGGYCKALGEVAEKIRQAAAEYIQSLSQAQTGNMQALKGIESHLSVSSNSIPGPPVGASTVGASSGNSEFTKKDAGYSLKRSDPSSSECSVQVRNKLFFCNSQDVIRIRKGECEMEFPNLVNSGVLEKLSTNVVKNTLMGVLNQCPSFGKHTFGILTRKAKEFEENSMYELECFRNKQVFAKLLVPGKTLRNHPSNDHHSLGQLGCDSLHKMVHTIEQSLGKQMSKRTMGDRFRDLGHWIGK